MKADLQRQLDRMNDRMYDAETELNGIQAPEYPLRESISTAEMVLMQMIKLFPKRKQAAFEILWHKAKELKQIEDRAALVAAMGEESDGAWRPGSPQGDAPGLVDFTDAEQIRRPLW